MRTVIGLLVIVSASLSCCAADLKGRVLDTSGVMVHKTYIIIHWDSAGMKGMKENIGIPGDKTLRPDQRGAYTIDLPPGTYDVFVTAPGFQPTCEKISIVKGQTAEYDVELKVSSGELITVD